MAIEHSPVARRRFLTSTAMASVAVGAFGSTVGAAEMTDKEKANAAVVNDFCAAWKTGDAAKVGSFLADTCVVRFTAQQDGSAPVVGRAGVTEQVGKYLTGTKIEFMVHDVQVKGPIVMNRRTDRIVSQTGTRDIEIVGVFFVRQGKIKEWLDFSADA